MRSHLSVLVCVPACGVESLGDIALCPCVLQVTGRSLRVWRRQEMEVLCEALRLQRPPPRPPLTWLHAFADRNEYLCDQVGTCE